MRKLVFTALICSIAFGNAMERRAQDRNPESEERHKRIEACTTPDRPKPPVENERKGPELCGKAISLPKPLYPEEAKAQGISGVVTINMVTDENGDVIWAKAVQGHPLLQAAALRAACQARYSPETVSKRPIKVSRVITYNFLPQ
jgi:TonB family protein